MDIRDLLYYHRQYRNYARAGMVPKMTCDVCDVHYFPRTFDYDTVELWCMNCDYRMSPGETINNYVVKRVKEIEE